MYLFVLYLQLYKLFLTFLSKSNLHIIHSPQRTPVLISIHFPFSSNPPFPSPRHPLIHFLLFFLRLYIFIFRERGREGEIEGEKHGSVVLAEPQLGTWPATQACALTGNQTSDLLVCRPALSPLSHTSQGPQIYFL